MKLRSILPGLFYVSLLFTACKKEGIKTSTDKGPATKINSWLDQKAFLHSPLVEAIKRGVDFSKLTVEQSENGEKIIIVPMKAGFNGVSAINKNAIASLVLIDSAGTIRRGNLVYSSKTDNSDLASVPTNSFYNIYNTGHVPWDSRFQFFNMAGEKVYELSYKGNRLSSAAIAQPKFHDDPNGKEQATAGCIDWYLVTTYYDENGTIVNQTSVYLRTTCPMGRADPEFGGASTDYEFAIVKPWTWVVNKDPNLYYTISSTEEVTGVRKSTEYMGGHFTSIIHKLSYLSLNTAANTSNWKELSATVSKDYPYQVSAYVTGNISFGLPGAQTTLTLENIGAVLFFRAF